MKLLIISSEPLNPDNVLGSIFELTQAAILKNIAEVCILSVSPFDSMTARLKGYLNHSKISKDNILSTLVFGTNRTNVYIIEGISVIEGKNYNWFSRGSYLKSLRNWVKAGLAAFREYKIEFGIPDVIHAHGRFLNAGALALAIFKETKIPFVYTEHSSSYQLGSAPKESLPILQEIADNASAFTAVSKSLLNDFEFFLGRQVPHALVIPNTMDSVFEGQINKILNPDHFSFLNISSLRKVKGLDILLKSFKTAFDGNSYYKLTICGDGPLRNELVALRDKLGLQQTVEFKGNISKQEIKEMLDSSHALVVSSLRETFGVAVIEALSRGCPVVSTRCGGPEEILNDDSGILVNTNDENGLAEALKSMTSNYSQYDINKIRNKTIARFGSEAFLSASEILYRSVL